MSSGLKYPDYDEALNVYYKTIDASGGGLHGVKDEGGIKKVLDFVQNDLYYPTFIDKLTYLIYGICTGHYFEDCNKRIALTLGVWFLFYNGHYWHAANLMPMMEAFIYHVAAGRIDKDLLHRIIECYMANEDYPESLQLEIIHAIKKEDPEDVF